MKFLLGNPEFVRNARGQLRPSRMIISAVLMAVISCCMVYVFHRISEQEVRYSHLQTAAMWGRQLLQAILWMQALILAAGGSIVCINSIYKEKEQNSFDYQRMTQLTPLELALGKLFGAPVLMYFLCLCLTPAALLGAFAGRVRISFVVAAYAVLILGSIAFHIFSLLVSLLAFRGANTSVIVLVLLVLWLSAYGAAPFNGTLRIGTMGPFLAPELSIQTIWNVQELKARFGYFNIDVDNWANGRMIATAFGHDIHQAAANLTVSLTIALWFLVAVARNIKRDPSVYEIFSPLQGLGFAVYVNVLFLAFMKWQGSNPVDAEAFFLTMNIFIFAGFGMSQLRNRERMRIAIRNSASAGRSMLFDAIWPLPLLFVGASIAGLMGAFGMAMNHDVKAEWSLNFALLRALFFVLWIIRDIQYLQWMNLRRGKFPLVLGVTFLAVYYACASIMLAAFGAFRDTSQVPYTAFFLPSPFYLLDDKAWLVGPGVWSASFLLQMVLIGIFLFLQRRTMHELVPGTQPTGVQPVEA